MEKTFLSMEQILDRVNEWKTNIDYDLKSDFLNEEEKGEYLRQSTQLACCIGILTTLGDNNNILKA